MKNVVFLLVAFLLMACGRPDSVTITGQVNNPDGETVEVFYFKNLATNERESVEVTLDEENKFKAVLPLHEPGFISLRASRRVVPLYMEPGNAIHIVMDGSKPESIPVISGDAALESGLLAAYDTELARHRSYFLALRDNAGMAPAEFVDYAWGLYDEKMGYLESDHRYEELSGHFMDQMHLNILYDTYGLLFEFPNYARRYRDEEVELPEDYYDFLEEAVVSRDEYVTSRPYVSFMTLYLRHRVTEAWSEEETRGMTRMQFDYAGELFSGKLRDMIMSQQVVSGLNFGSFEEGLQMYEAFLALNPSAQMRQLVKDEHAVVMQLAPGAEAPGFTLTDIDGNEVSLSDFLGKVVYLDFWASWCGPCLQQIPHARELKKRMADQDDLVFLYISVDTDEQAWRNKVAEENIQGVHLNVAGFAHDVPQSYNLKGVPTFYLIGRDGKIFDNRPPRPSFEDVDEVLAKALAT